MDSEKPFWFPSLTDEEIIDALDAWGLSATPKLLAKPTEDFVIAVYTKCIEDVFGISQSVLHEPVQTALSSVRAEYVDLHSNGVGLNILCYHITRFAAAAKILDFSIKDVVLPDSKRTRRIISAFVNFINFTEQNTAEVAALRQRSSKITEERERLLNDLVRIRGELAAIEQQRSKDEPRCEELRKENAAITAELIASQEFQTRILADIEALKAEKAAVLHEKENLSKDTSQATDAVSRTRSRVVKSPERLRRNISIMGSTQAEDKRALANAEAKIRDLQAKATALLTIEKDVRDCIEQVRVVEKEVLALETSCRQLAETRDNLEERRIARTELELKLERAQNQLTNAQEKLERARRDLDERRAAGQQTIERLQREYESMASERKDNDKQVEGLRQQANAIERKTAEHLKVSTVELGELLEEYWNVRKGNEIYMETLANKLGMQVSSR